MGARGKQDHQALCSRKTGLSVQQDAPLGATRNSKGMSDKATIREVYDSYCTICWGPFLLQYLLETTMSLLIMGELLLFSSARLIMPLSTYKSYSHY